MKIRHITRARKCFNQIRYCQNDHGAGKYRRNSEITKKIPQLQESQTSHPRNGEQTDPFHTQGSTQSKTCKSKPCPPIYREYGAYRARGGCSVNRTSRTPGRRSTMILSLKNSPRPSCEGGTNNQRGVQEDKSRLRDKPVFKCNKHRAEDSSSLSTPTSPESHVNDRNDKDAHNRR